MGWGRARGVSGALWLGQSMLEHPMSFGELLGPLAGALCSSGSGRATSRAWGGCWLWQERDAPGLQPSLRGCTMAFCLRGCPGNIPPSQFPSNMKPRRGCLPEHKAWGCCRGQPWPRSRLPPHSGTCAPSLLGLRWVARGCLPGRGPAWQEGGGRNQGSPRNGAVGRPRARRTSVRGCG